MLEIPWNRWLSVLISFLVLVGCNGTRHSDLQVNIEQVTVSSRLKTGQELTVNCELEFKNSASGYEAEISTAIADYISDYVKKHDMSPSATQILQAPLTVDDGEKLVLDNLVAIELTQILNDR